MISPSRLVSVCFFLYSASRRGLFALARVLQSGLCNYVYGGIMIIGSIGVLDAVFVLYIGTCFLTCASDG